MIPTKWNHGGTIAVKTTVVHHSQMSREDPQFKLRLPADLRAQAELAAKSSGRSLNSELVARIEASFLGELSGKLIPASRAKELSSMARAKIPDEIRRRIVESVNRAVSLGHTSAAVNLTDLQLDVGIPAPDLELVVKELSSEIKQAGYKLDWDDITSLGINF